MEVQQRRFCWSKFYNNENHHESNLISGQSTPSEKNIQDKLLGYLLNKDMKTETHVSFMGKK